MVFLDASKAFDKVWHRGLIYKLQQLGVNDNLLMWFKDYLQDRKIRTVIEGEHSEWKFIRASVPQGSILGPLLFLVFINDIVDDIGTNICLFADDTSLCQSVDRRHPELAFNILNRDLKKLVKWANLWHITFNPDKTEYVIFSNRHLPSYPSLYMGNQSLHRTSNHKHLGLTLDENMNWNEHITNTTTKANKLIGTMWKLGNNIPRYCLEIYYVSYIRPIIEYACVCYDNMSKYQSTQLEKVQRRAAIACTKAYNRTSTEVLLGELSWPTLAQRRDYHKQVLFFKMVKGRVPNYLHTLLPPTRATLNSRSNTRFAEKRHVPSARTEGFRRSFIPSYCRTWNNLQSELTMAPTLSNFKFKLKQHMFPLKKTRLQNDFGRAYVNQTRMRLGLSALNDQRAKYNLITNSCCAKCGYNHEDTNHYFLKCPHYSAIREVLLEKSERLLNPHGVPVNTTNPEEQSMLIKVFLHGSPLIPLDANIALSKLVQDYIKNSKRF